MEFVKRRLCVDGDKEGGELDPMKPSWGHQNARQDTLVKTRGPSFSKDSDKAQRALKPPPLLALGKKERKEEL